MAAQFKIQVFKDTTPWKYKAHFCILKTVLSPWQHVPYNNTSHISSTLLHLRPPLVIMLFCHMNVYSDKMQHTEATE